MTRAGFAIIALGAVLFVLRAVGVIDSEVVDVVVVIAVVVGAIAIAIDAERGDGPQPTEKPDVTLGGGGRHGPITRFGFGVIAVGVIGIALRITGVIDTEFADLASVIAIVAGAIVVAVDGEREVDGG